jgi:hypothetical protein
MAEPYLALSRSDRLEALLVAATTSGRPVYLLEKDVWVTTPLLFDTTSFICETASSWKGDLNAATIEPTFSAVYDS